MTVEVRWGSASHPGCVRTQNQDSVLAGPNLFLVADGMGGHLAGEVASALAVAEMTGGDPTSSLTTFDVLQAVARANERILDAAAADPAKQGMGTTMAGVALVEDGAGPMILVFNVGDSRVYRAHADVLSQVTEDHSMVGELVREGRMTPEEAESHESKHVVTRILGFDGESTPDVWRFSATIGDRYLVCSDGLTNELDLAELTRVMFRGAGLPQPTADELVQGALDRGARDNVSVVIVEVTAVTTDGPNEDDDTNPRVDEDSSAVEDDDTLPNEDDALTRPTSLITGVPSPDDLRGELDAPEARIADRAAVEVSGTLDAS